MLSKTLLVLGICCAPLLAQYDPTVQLPELQSALGLDESQALTLRLALEDFGASYQILSSRTDAEIDFKVEIRKLRRQMMRSLKEKLSEAQLEMLDKSIPNAGQLVREIEELSRFDSALTELKLHAEARAPLRAAFAEIIQTRRREQGRVNQQKAVLKEALADPATSDAQIFALFAAIEATQDTRRAAVEAAEDAFLALLSPRQHAELVVRNLIDTRRATR